MYVMCFTGNKLADRSKLAKLQEMSNNEFGFTMDTLITAGDYCCFWWFMCCHIVRFTDDLCKSLGPRVT